MTTVHLRYDKMVERALRGVVREALEEVAANGLPGDHHFYITFLTRHPGVRMPEFLRAQYKREMTIVLQFQFFDLMVRRDGFGVTLSFGGAGERLEIPFEAIVTFADPAVNFALQFQTEQSEDEDEELEALSDEAGEELDEEEKPADEAGDEPETGKVVALDAFRKKP